MADRRALVITAPGPIGLRDAAELVPGPGEAVGPGVTGLEPGQPVIAEGIIPDRVCAQCVQGHTNLCLTYDELGFTRAGAAADQVLLPAQVVHVLGDQVSLLDAALAEPAAVAWRAIGRGQPRPGGADRGRRRRHAGPGHGPSAPAVLTRRADRLRAAPGAGRAGRGARGDRVRDRRPPAGPGGRAVRSRGRGRGSRGRGRARARAGPPRRPRGARRASRERRPGRLPIDDVVNNDLAISA